MSAFVSFRVILNEVFLLLELNLEVVASLGLYDAAVFAEPRRFLAGFPFKAPAVEKDNQFQATSLSCN